MKIAYILLLLTVLPLSIAFAQIAAEGGGEYQPPVANCMSEGQREQIMQMLDTNVELLTQQARLGVQQKQTLTISFAWPLRQAQGFNDPSYYGISNFVDHNAGYPNQLTDYNCGTRTYDLSSGYNHAGTDIFLWPFSRTMQSLNQVQVIAAEAGTIIGKEDGNFDESCSMCSNCNWNAIYIQHADGSVAWYGHFKNNTLTLKGIGQAVSKGEYLGFVGSSGSSTGPHLHFEVYKSAPYTAANRIDPFAGPCNTLNGNVSYWDEQKSYREPTLNKVMTHDAPPNFNTQTCPALETVNEQNNFQRGQLAYFGSYYHDQLQGTTSSHIILQPDFSVFRSWTHNAPTSYNASWWYWSYTLPSNAPHGTWRYLIAYNGQTVEHQFTVGLPAGTGKALAGGYNISIYPNPARENFYIQSDLAFARPAVEVYDVVGRLVHKHTGTATGSTTVEVPVSTWAEGVYFINVYDKEQLVHRSKLVR